MMKKFKKIITTIIVIILSINKCYAFGGFSVSVPSIGNGGASNVDQDGYVNKSWTDESDSSITYTCKYKYDIDSSASSTIYGFNQDGEDIINGDMSVSENILAGTAIGFNITETKKVKYTKPTIEFKAEKRNQGASTYNCCTYYYCERTICNSNNPIYTIVRFKIPLLYIVQPPIDDSPCTIQSNYFVNPQKGWNCSYYERCNNYSSQQAGKLCTEIPGKVTNEEIKDGTNARAAIAKKKCEEDAYGEAMSAAQNALSPSYTITLKNPNDINNNDIEKNITANDCGVKIGREHAGKEVTCNYTYSISNVCINRKTANVSYRSENCKSNEIKVPNGQSGNMTYWKYFVPLNAKSNDNFILLMSPANMSEPQNSNVCKKIINDYPTSYRSYIKNSSGGTLPSNKNEAIKIVEKGIKNQDVKSGCLVASSVTIPITQLFYNENKTNGANKILGYGTYFRQIDINNPFPNGLNNNSYWKSKNIDYDKTNNENIVTVKDANGNKKTYNLNESFENNNKMYSIKNVNRNIIETYNNDFYTSWDNMDNDGYSEFVKKYVTTENSKSHYKLGCGPANANMGGC